MKMSRWSDYEKYIVMLTSYNSTAKGVSLGYQAFLDFKRAFEIGMFATNVNVNVHLNVRKPIETIRS